MKQIEQIDRQQILMMSLEILVAPDSMVRVVDLFLDYVLDTDLGFKVTRQITGRPSFPVRTLLGIYIYGYLTRIRSSRELARACQTNIELWWLLNGHKPCYKTIANFRKDNRVAFSNLFKVYRDFCKSLALFGNETIAVDGSKFRAQNSKKNNFNEAKINRQMEYIETKQKEYLDSLEGEDKKEAESDPNSHQRMIDLASRKEYYESLREHLKKTDSLQISTIDPDARALPLHMNIVEVGYNVQSAVDDKHNLIVDFEVTNEKDNNALAPMSIKSKESLGLTDDDSITVLADKGYYKGEQLQKCHKHNIETLVAIKDYTDKTKPEHVTKDKFQYNSSENTYTCPNGRTLVHQAKYTRRKKGKVISEFDRYSIRHSICINCKYYNDCVSTAKKKNSQGRCIDRATYQDAIDRNNLNVKSRKEEYDRLVSIY